MKIQITLISLLLSAAGLSQNISTEAPSVSASAVTIPKGQLQGEFSAGFDVNNEGPETYFQSSELPFLLTRYALTDRWEFRTQHGTQFTSINGINNYQYTSFGVGVKYSILPNDGNTNLAVIANYSPFNGIWRAQQGDLTLAFSQVLSESNSIGGNLGYSRFAVTAEGFGVISNQNSYLASAYYSFNFADKWTAFGEFSIDTVNFLPWVAKSLLAILMVLISDFSIFCAKISNWIGYLDLTSPTHFNSTRWASIFTSTQTKINGNQRSTKDCRRLDPRIWSSILR